jgi:uncharacterized protein YdaU (DUF1376 family)
MAEFPALPLFTDAYLGDTTHLTTIEHGAYLLLLMVAWRSRGCRLPDDDKMLARYAKCTAGQWRRIRPVLIDFFDVGEGFWTQRRLTDEYDHVRQVRQSQSAAGHVSALKRKGRHSTDVGADRAVSGNPHTHTPPIEESENSSSPSVSEAGEDAGLPFDLVDLTDRLARIAGVRHVDPTGVTRNMSEVKNWLELGADVASTIIPTIQRVVSESDVPVHSLRYFDGAIRRAHALKAQGARNGSGRSNDLRNPLARAAAQFLDSQGSAGDRAEGQQHEQPARLGSR